MIREEAINLLDNLIGMVDDNHGSDYDEALKMGKEALEQEPCEDAISREELLKAIDTWDRFGVDDTNSLFRLDNLSLPHYVPYIHYDDVIKCIKGMTSVNPQTKTGVLDKISSEIKDEISDHIGADNYDAVYGLQLALYIINKYKAESEDAEE